MSSDSDQFSVPENGANSVASTLVGASWQEQDGLLRDLWMQNKTQQEISDALGRSVAAIMTRAARLGLPRRAAPGRKPGSTRRVLDGHDHDAPPRASLPRQSSSRASGDAIPAAAQPSTRICLMCLSSFPSQGRHNRICSSCKGTAEYGSAVALADIHFPI